MRTLLWLPFVLSVIGCSKNNPLRADCADGASASQVSIVSGRSSVLTATCEDGKPTLIVRVEPRYERTYPIRAALWDSFWTRLERANWRAISSQCTSSKEAREYREVVGDDVSEVGVEITDGKAQAGFDCEVDALASAHVEIALAFEELSNSEDE